MCGIGKSQSQTQLLLFAQAHLTSLFKQFF
jgi:hypothetical protein